MQHADVEGAVHASAGKGQDIERLGFLLGRVLRSADQFPPDRLPQVLEDRGVHGRVLFLGRARVSQRTIGDFGRRRGQTRRDHTTQGPQSQDQEKPPPSR